MPLGLQVACSSEPGRLRILTLAAGLMGKPNESQEKPWPFIVREVRESIVVSTHPQRLNSLSPSYEEHQYNIVKVNIAINSPSKT